MTQLAPRAQPARLEQHTNTVHSWRRGHMFTKTFPAEFQVSLRERKERVEAGALEKAATPLWFLVSILIGSGQTGLLSGMKRHLGRQATTNRLACCIKRSKRAMSEREDAYVLAGKDPDG